MKQVTKKGWTRRPAPLYQHPLVVLAALFVAVVMGLSLADSKSSDVESTQVVVPAQSADGCDARIRGYACRIDAAIEAATR